MTLHENDVYCLFDGEPDAAWVHGLPMDFMEELNSIRFDVERFSCDSASRIAGSLDVLERHLHLAISAEIDQMKRSSGMRLKYDDMDADVTTCSAVEMAGHYGMSSKAVDHILGDVRNMNPDEQRRFSGVAAALSRFSGSILDMLRVSESLADTPRIMPWHGASALATMDNTELANI